MLRTLSIILLFFFSQISNANDDTEKYIQACLFLEFLKILKDNPNPLINEEGLEMLADASAKLNKINFENALHTQNVSLETVKYHLALLAESEYNRFVNKSEKSPYLRPQTVEQPPQTVERPNCQFPQASGHPNHNYFKTVENFLHQPYQIEEDSPWQVYPTFVRPPYQPTKTEEGPSCHFSHNNPTFIEDGEELFLKPTVPFWHQHQKNSPQGDLELLISGDSLWNNA